MPTAERASSNADALRPSAIIDLALPKDADRPTLTIAQPPDNLRHVVLANMSAAHNWFQVDIGGRQLFIFLHGGRMAEGIGGEGPFISPSQVEAFKLADQEARRITEEQRAAIDAARRTALGIYQDAVDAIRAIVPDPDDEEHPLVITENIVSKLPYPDAVSPDGVRRGPLVDREDDPTGETMEVDRLVIVDPTFNLRFPEMVTDYTDIGTPGRPKYEPVMSPEGRRIQTFLPVLVAEQGLGMSRDLDYTTQPDADGLIVPNLNPAYLFATTGPDQFAEALQRMLTAGQAVNQMLHSV